MKRILFLLLFPAFSHAQIIKIPVAGSDFGRQNKSFSLTDKRDFPDFSEYNHPDGFYFDTVISANLTAPEWHKNIKTWLATNFTSLPNILKLDDTDHIIIHSSYDLNDFTLDYRMKNGKAKILLTDFATEETQMWSANLIQYYYNKYINNAYGGGKRAKYYEKKRSLLILNDFNILADWIRNKCIPSIEKNKSNF